jgi:hypothetical protein
LEEFLSGGAAGVAEQGHGVAAAPPATTLAPPMFKYEQFCNRNAVHDVDMSEMSTKRHGSCSSAYSFKERRYFFFVANWKCQTHNMKLQGNLGDVRHHGFMTE